MISVFFREMNWLQYLILLFLFIGSVKLEGKYLIYNYTYKLYLKLIEGVCINLLYLEFSGKNIIQLYLPRDGIFSIR